MNQELEVVFVPTLSSIYVIGSSLKVLEKRLDFACIQWKVNEPELRKYFEESWRRMRIKCHFQNEPSDNVSEIQAFRPNS